MDLSQFESNLSELTESDDPYKLFADLLVKQGKLGKTELRRAERLTAQSQQDKLPALLLKLGMVAERDVTSALAEVSGLPLVEKTDYPEIPTLENSISPRFMKTHRVVGLSIDEEKASVAVADPLDLYVISALRLACARPVLLSVGLATEIENAVEKQLGSGKSQMGQLVDTIDGDGDYDEDDVEHLKDLASEAPVIRMVSLIMQRAVESRASDIHVEPFENQLKVRLRIDGVLREIEAPPVRSTAAVISRIKIMAKLNIAERRLPQDGRIKVQVVGKELELRVSTVPTMHGESVVIRLLDKDNVVLDFESLGFRGKPLNQFTEVLEIPHGIVLITGPTGSGKSTTLYTGLNKLNSPERKIITVEDPVEYQLPGVNQIQVKSQIGLTFAGALRSIVRQDPDVIMIGEMRDLETARIAVQSALTGHLVMSTLHTNDAAGGITRLMDMGLEDYLLVSTVNGILAQRLVRRLCSHCREPFTAMPELVEEMRLDRFTSGDKVTLYKPVGCDKCNNIGYRGRLSIVEFLTMSDEIRRLVMTHAQARELEAQALKEGMISMMDDGLQKSIDGDTTVEEVMRVTTDS
ncbi:MAG: type II secretion system ATPase GspE [Gammaproteobacteria bacterium]|nr:type II secretion system ATPase GspE [Gammaproteobacteria bacterium]